MKPTSTENINRLTSIVLIVALVLTTTVMAIMGKGNIFWVVLAFTIALIFINIEKIKIFRLATELISLEAEMNSAIVRTYAALEELKDLALAISEPMIVNLTMSGHIFQHITDIYKLESVEKIVGVLEKLGASEKEIHDACGFIYEQIQETHYRLILAKLGSEDFLNKEIYKGFREWDFSTWNKERIEKFAKDNALEFDSEAKELMMDLDYFLETKKLRRPEVWQS